MGNNTSTQLIDQTQSIIAKALTDITTNVRNGKYANVKSWQREDIDITGANMKRCPMNIGQDTSLTSNVLSQFDTDVANDVTQKVQSELQALISQTLDQINKSIPLGDSNNADVRTKIKQSVNQLLQASITSNIKNVMYETSSTNQYISYRARYFVCKNSPITINQTSTINAVSRGAATNTITNIVTNEATADIKAKIDQEVKQANTGLDFCFMLIILALGLIAILYFILKHNPITAVAKGAGKVAKGAGKVVGGVGKAVKGTAKAATDVVTGEKSMMKPVLAITSFLGAVSSLVYGLIRSGKIDNPLAPEAAR